MIIFQIFPGKTMHIEQNDSHVDPGLRRDDGFFGWFVGQYKKCASRSLRGEGGQRETLVG